MLGNASFRESSGINLHPRKQILLVQCIQITLQVVVNDTVGNDYWLAFVSSMAKAEAFWKTSSDVLGRAQSPKPAQAQPV
jgi:hypothetical protein